MASKKEKTADSPGPAGKFAGADESLAAAELENLGRPKRWRIKSPIPIRRAVRFGLVLNHGEAVTDELFVADQFRNSGYEVEAVEE